MLGGSRAGRQERLRPQHDDRTGSRVHEVMTEIAKGLEEGVVADLAAYYAGQRKREPDPSTLADPRAAIVQLVELGDPKRGLPPCASCHWLGCGGPIETSILAEQNHDDLVRQLETYARTRAPAGGCR